MLLVRLIIDLNDRSIIIDQIGVPTSLQQKGLGQEVLSGEIYDQLQNIKDRFLSARAQTFSLPAYNTFPDFEIPETKLSYKALVRLVQEVCRIHPLHVGGEVIAGAKPGSFAVLVRFRGGATLKTLDPIKVEEGDASTIPVLFARAILEEVDPQILAAYMWERNERSSAKALVLAQIEQAGHPTRTVWIHDLRGLLLESANKLEDAQHEFEGAIAADPNKETPHLLLAELFERKQKLDQTQQEFEIAKRLNSKSPFVYSLWASLLQERGDSDEAKKKLEEGIVICGDCEKGHLSLGNYFLEKKDYTDAEIEFRKAISLEPSAPRPHSHLGRVLYTTSHREEAAAEYERAVQLSPNDDGVYSDWGEDLEGIGDWFGAAEKFQRSLEINPYTYVGFDFMYPVAKSPSALSDAVEGFKRAKDPKYAPEYVSWGETLLLATPHDYAGALAKLKIAGMLDPNLIDVYTTTAMVYTDMNDSDHAIQVLTKAVHTHPHDFQLLVALGNALSNGKQYQRAVDVYDSALRASPTPKAKAVVYRELAGAYFLKNDLRLSKIANEKAEEIDPSPSPF